MQPSWHEPLSSAHRLSGELEAAEILVKKLRIHFSDEFKGDAVEQVMQAADMMDQWFWSESLPEDQAKDIQKLNDSGKKLEGHPDAQEQLEEFRLRLRKKELMRVAMKALAAVFHHGSSSDCAWVAEGKRGTALVAEEKVTRVEEDKKRKAEVNAPKQEEQITEAEHEIKYHGEPVPSRFLEYFKQAYPGKDTEDFKKIFAQLEDDQDKDDEEFNKLKGRLG